jgi:hypothetical protein
MTPNSGSDKLCQRISESDKTHDYPLPPLLEAADSQLFASPDGLTCFAKINASHRLVERQASGRSFFLGPQTFIWRLGMAGTFGAS